MTTTELNQRASKTIDRLRSEGKSERANRFAGRAERVITRAAARAGELLPTLYVSYDGQWLITWPGNRVARLETTGKAPAFHCTLICYSAVIEGRRYYGRGLGNGMYLNLRPGKKVS